MLQVEHLSYDVVEEGKQSEILSDVSFTVNDGEMLVITGPNGGGKSTLAKLIMGIEKPTGGRILFNGQDITDLPIYERSKLGIGYAFQTPARFKGMTVRKLLSLASGKELPPDECSQYLTAVGLCSADYLNREVDSSLSGGEVKRIEIATLMARNLELAIYDEPEAGIDLWSFAKLVESFKTISKRRHKTVLIISHQERIMQLADEIIIVANGRIAKQGPKDEIFPGLLHDLGEENTCAFRKGSD